MSSTVEIVRRAPRFIANVRTQDPNRELRIDCYGTPISNLTVHVMTRVEGKWRSKYLGTTKSKSHVKHVSWDGSHGIRQHGTVITVCRNDNGEWHDDGSFTVPSEQRVLGAFGWSNDNNAVSVVMHSYISDDNVTYLYKRDAMRRWRRCLTRIGNLWFAMWSPDNSMVVLCFTGYAQLVDVVSKTTLMSLSTPSNYCDAKWIDAEHFILASSDIVDFDQGVHVRSKLQLVTASAHAIVATIYTPIVYEMCVSPDGQRIAVLHEDRLDICQVPKPGDTELKSVFMPILPERIRSMLFSPMSAYQRQLFWYPESNRLLVASMRLVAAITVVPWSPRAHRAFAHELQLRVFAVMCSMSHLCTQRRPVLPLEVVLIVCQFMII